MKGLGCSRVQAVLLMQNAVKCVASGGHYLASGGGDDQIHLYDIKVTLRLMTL
jgi:hypothetical protein